MQVTLTKFFFFITIHFQSSLCVCLFAAVENFIYLFMASLIFQFQVQPSLLKEKSVDHPLPSLFHDVLLG